MSDPVVTAESFAPAVEKIFSEFESSVISGLEGAARAAGKAGAASARAGSPRDTGGYASGWSWELEPGLDGAGVYVRVFNRKKPSLTHLLELGHEIWVGGHDTGRRAPGTPHIAPAADAASAAFEGAIRL